MRALLILTFIVTAMTTANANPVVAVPPSYMLAGENVTINVYQTESKVEGDYTFRTQRPSTDRRIYVTFPVIFTTNGMLTAQQILVTSHEQVQRVAAQSWDLAKPKGTIDGNQFSIQTTPGPISWSYPEVQRRMPQAWACQFFGGRAPADPAKKQVNIRLSYVQPHLPGNISPYMPMLPDDVVKTNYLITFKAREGARLAPLGNYEVVGEVSDSVLSVRPTNLQLLQVQVK